MQKKLLHTLILLTLSVSSLSVAEITSDQINASNLTADGQEKVPSKDLYLFTEIFDHLKHNYVEPVTDETLITNAINGLMALDPHSKYYTQEEYQAIKNRTSGAFAGIGVELSYNADNKVLTINKIFDQSPAQKSGLKVGDQIVTIDQTPISEIDPNQYSAKIQGPIGTEVILDIIRAKEPLNIKLIRANVPTPSLSIAKLYNKEFAYLRLDHFQNGSDQEIIKALDQLEAQAKAEHSTIKGIVLDLRNNPGGLLSAAVETADLFLDEGLITYTDGQSDDFKNRYSAKNTQIFPNIPLIVLINAQSASSAEIVAGALQDHKRALIVGENSFGKGSIQIIKPLVSGGAIRYTSARYYTPTGRSIQNNGITPDILIPVIKGNIEPAKASREVNQKGHLQNTSPEMVTPSVDFSPLIQQGDYYLYEALNMLRAMNALPAQIEKAFTTKEEVSAPK